jgi:hypothetical protein
MASSLEMVQKYGLAMDVSTTVVALWAAISGWVNMDMYARVGTYKKADYSDMADAHNKAAEATVWIGLLTTGVLFGLLMYQGALGRGAYTSKKSQGAAIAQLVFAFVAFILVFLNVGYGIELYQNTATWSTKRTCDTTSPQAKLAAMRRSAAQRKGGYRANTDEDAAKAASNDVNFQYATIGIASSILVAFVVYIVYFARTKRNLGGGRLRPYNHAVSEFFTY